MTNILRRQYRTMAVLVLASVITFGLAGLNNDGGSLGSATAQVVTDSAAVTMVGASAGGCGILVGAIGGVIALGIAGATVGIGAALAISATIHVGAILCAT